MHTITGNEKGNEKGVAIDVSKAGIFDEDEVQVCTKDSTDPNCYNPNSIREAFRPLGLFAKCFGMFPCYNFSLVQNLEDPQIRWKHCLDYAYTGIVCIIMTAGAILCAINPPQVIMHLKENANNNKDKTDQIVIQLIFYSTMGAGLMSMFIFPRSASILLEYLQHFSQLDKILRFDGRDEERSFARRLLVINVGVLLGCLAGNASEYMLELPEKPKCYVDFIMVPTITLAVIVLLCPTSLFIFFVNAIRLRMLHFNNKLEKMVKPITPNCFSCSGFKNYGGELEGKSWEKKSIELSKNIEKMRILHAELSTLVCKTSFIFGSHLVREFLYSFAAIILYTYFILYISVKHFDYWYVYVLFVSFLVLKLLFICATAQYITCMGIASRKILLKASVLHLSPECANQIQMFISKVANPSEITAGEYFTINRHLITSMLAAISTYFIILIQFKVGEGRCKPDAHEFSIEGNKTSLSNNLTDSGVNNVFMFD